MIFREMVSMKEKYFRKSEAVFATVFYEKSNRNPGKPQSKAFYLYYGIKSFVTFSCFRRKKSA